ncbi:hypothetical protein ACTMU2_21265 [Cupriavidus basilensis]
MQAPDPVFLDDKARRSCGATGSGTGDRFGRDLEITSVAVSVKRIARHENSIGA